MSSPLIRDLLRHFELSLDRLIETHYGDTDNTLCESFPRSRRDENRSAVDVLVNEHRKRRSNAEIGKLSHSVNSRIDAACRYGLSNGGKRVRPLLVFLSSYACGGEPEDAIAPALAVEMIHTYSLVHDDLPMCDNDPVRRGKPSMHVAFDDATALLCGDALLTDAFCVLTDERAFTMPAPIRVQLVAELARAAGSRGMVHGQMLDLSGWAKDPEQLSTLHLHKTGKLLAASCAMGAVAAGAGAEHVDRLRSFGAQLGLAFQVMDDVLDDEKTTGKSVGKDRAQGKATYLSLLGRTEALALAQRLTASARDTLHDFSPTVQPLRWFAESLLDRTV